MNPLRRLERSDHILIALGHGVEDFDCFVRAHYFGFTALLIIGGAATSSRPVAIDTIVSLLVIAMCFHVFSYALNDVIDLDLDRTQPRRRNDPLVRGAISRRSALGIAFSGVPLSFLAVLYLADFKPRANPWALVTLALAFALMSIYNSYGKKLDQPWVTDLVQAIAWGCLALLGALAADPEPYPRLALACSRAAVFFAYGALFIFLINGIHGGLRDLVTDRAGGKNTLAIKLGANIGADGHVESNSRIMCFAYAVQTAMCITVVIHVWKDRSHFPALWLTGLISTCLFLGNYLLLHRVVRMKERRRNFYVSFHLLTLLLPPLVILLTSSTPDALTKAIVLFGFFLPLCFQEPIPRRSVEIILSQRGVKLAHS